MASDSTREHQVTLKVMRLAKPNFAAAPYLPNLIGNEMDLSHLSADPMLSALKIPLPNTEELVLPQSFETIYLGETFTCYVCVHNDSERTVQNVSIKVDLQTSTQRVSLPCKFSESTIGELAPSGRLDQVISHEVKEIGQHILVCAVTYTAENEGEKYLRKFFKFPVSKPLDVKTKFYNAESDDVYLEALIQNTSHLPMVMEKVTLDPSESYSATELNTISPAAENRDAETTFSTLPYLPPQASRQYLYCLRPKAELPKGVTSIGKLEMIWRTSLGERGRLQTSQLQRMAPGYGDLRLTISSAPSAIKQQTILEIHCRLQNCSDRALDLIFNVDETLTPGVVWCSKLNTKLGQLQPNFSMDLTLKLLPISAGLQVISGVRLTDTFLKRTYEHDEIAHIFVYS